MNKFVIIGWLGGNSEMFVYDNIGEGQRVTKELQKSPAWRPVWAGTLLDLIDQLKGDEE